MVGKCVFMCPVAERLRYGEHTVEFTVEFTDEARISLLRAYTLSLVLQEGAIEATGCI